MYFSVFSPAHLPLIFTPTSVLPHFSFLTNLGGNHTYIKRKNLYLMLVLTHKKNEGGREKKYKIKKFKIKLF